MAVLKKIKVALDSKLSQLSGSNIFAWENIDYNPALNQLYIRPTLLPSRSNTLDFDNNTRFTGIYQVDVFAPLNKGTKTILDKMDDIRDLFVGSRTLVQDDISVLIRTVSQVGPLRSDGSWLVGIVEIIYDCYSV